MSRPRSARAKTAAAPARGGRPGVFVSSPKSDIYVVMLSVALGAMMIGSLLMVMLLSKYEFKIKAVSNAPQVAATAQLLS